MIDHKSYLYDKTKSISSYMKTFLTETYLLDPEENKFILENQFITKEDIREHFLNNLLNENKQTKGDYDEAPE